MATSSRRSGLAALVLAVSLQVARPADAQAVRCTAEVEQALARADRAPQKEVAAELDKALAALDVAVGDATPSECHRLMGSTLLWRARAGGLPADAQRAMRGVALRELEVALQKQPDDVRTWELKAEAEEDAGLYVPAASTYLALARLRPDHGFARGARVRLLVKTGKPEAALAAAREWVAAQPQDWEAHLGLGIRLESAGKLEDALTAYRQATALDEGVDNAPLALGGLLARLGRWKEAEAAFAKVDAVEYLLGWYSQGLCRVKLGDMKGARGWVAKLKTQEGGEALARRLLELIKAPDSAPVLGLAAYAEP